MRFSYPIYLILGLPIQTTLAQAPPPSSLLTSAQTFASSLKATYRTNYSHSFPHQGTVTGDKQYEALIGNTLLNQAQGGYDFNNLKENGNDDQSWWVLAALNAAENGLPQTGPVAWIDIAKNAFIKQKGRWEVTRCGGGLRWKIEGGEGVPGWHYRSTIANGLFFQTAARIAKLTNDADALTWAEKAYDWIVKISLIDTDFNVYDGTDDAKGTGCVDVNHDQWSYNVGVFLHGSAVMAAHTKDPKWVTRTRGLIASAKRTFIDPATGALFEQKCEPSRSCNNDQVSFKATLARWLGATAVILPDVKADVAGIMDRAATVVQNGPKTGLNSMDSSTALEIVDASLRTQGWKPVKRTVAGRIHGS